MHDNNPYMFDFWANPAVHLKSSISKSSQAKKRKEDLRK